tara:strand:+ start:69 stop:251 length:183 start_codon:yes stop_codon:yes gene_type:complete
MFRDISSADKRNIFQSAQMEDFIGQMYLKSNRIKSIARVGELNYIHLAIAIVYVSDSQSI